ARTRGSRCATSVRKRAWASSDNAPQPTSRRRLLTMVFADATSRSKFGTTVSQHSLDGDSGASDITAIQQTVAVITASTAPRVALALPPSRSSTTLVPRHHRDSTSERADDKTQDCNGECHPGSPLPLSRDDHFELRQ